MDKTGGQVDNPSEANKRSGGRRLTTVLAADICGYSILAETDEAAAIAAVDVALSAFKLAVHAQSGRIFNIAGDGFFAEFPSALDAISAALAFQGQMNDCNKNAPKGIFAKIRMGLHVGDVIEQSNGDLLGHGVNVAARLQSEARPDGILVSQHLVNLVRGFEEAQFHRYGALTLKNIEEPVTAYELMPGTAKVPVWQRPLKELRGLKRKLAAPFWSALLLLAGSMLVLAVMLSYQAYQLQLEQKTQQIIALEKEIDGLSTSISKSQPGADQRQLTEIRDVAESLTGSKLEEKKNVIGLIEAERISEASSLLYQVYRDQLFNGAASEELLTTAREIGALTFYSNKEMAIEVYEKIWEVSGAEDYPVLIRLGQLYTRSSQPDKARDAYRTVLAGEAGAQSDIKAYIGLGGLHLRKNEYADAERFFLNALAIAERGGFQTEQAGALIALNVVMNNLEAYERAEAYGREALRLEQTLDPGQRSETRIGVAHVNLGVTLMTLGNDAEALEQFESALKLGERTNNRQNIVIALVNIGKVHFGRNRLEEAEKNLNRALMVAETETMNNARYIANRILSEIAYKQEDMQRACARFDEALQFYTRSPDKALQDFSDGLKEQCGR